MGTYEKLKEKHAERIKTMSEKFLKNLEVERTDRKALIVSGMNKNLFRKLKIRDEKFLTEYKIIHRKLSKTVLCRKCRSIYEPSGSRLKANNFAICVTCATRKQNEWLEGRRQRVIRMIATASLRNVCTLNIDQVLQHLDEIKWKCWLTGEIMSTQSGPNCLSPDRIDAKGEYTSKNVKFARRRINLMRGMLSINEFAPLCKAVSHKTIESGPVQWGYLKESARKLIRDAQRRGHDCFIDTDFVIAIAEHQLGRCHYTGLIMSIEKGKNIGSQISIDRVNPKFGYTMNNIVLCRLDINRMKYDMDDVVFRHECKLVAANS